MTTHSRIWAAVAATVLLSGCGKQGTLERPGPLIGSAEEGRPEVTARGGGLKTVDPRNHSRSDSPRP